MPEIDKETDHAFNVLKGKKIFFGHHSVGQNIVSGLQKINSQVSEESRINIIYSCNPEDYDGALFGHAVVGYNYKPESKNIWFSNFMDNLRQWSPDCAFYKYCYVDIDKSTNVEKLFQDYVDNMQMLKDKYPNTTFIHFTSPLTVLQDGLKAKVKKLIGRSIGIEENRKRTEYNELLRQRFRGIEPLFDLAEVESTPTHTVVKDRKGDNYQSLSTEYSSDGGHLNERGRSVVAIHLVKYLAKLVNV